MNQHALPADTGCSCTTSLSSLSFNQDDTDHVNAIDTQVSSFFYALILHFLLTCHSRTPSSNPYFFFFFNFFYGAFSGMPQTLATWQSILIFYKIASMKLISVLSVI